MADQVERCRRTFGEELLSGYLDGVLTQGDEQRVRLHLEDCRQCRSLVDEMGTLREATMTTDIHPPEDTQWDETPQGPVSRFFRSVGWLALVAWLVTNFGFLMWETYTNVEEIMAKFLVFSAVSGFLFLLLSVLFDRLRTLKTDRYRGVRK